MRTPKYYNEKGDTTVQSKSISGDEVKLYFRKILMDAYSGGASDVHLESYPRSGSAKLQFRIDGELHDIAELPIATVTQVVSYAKTMAKIELVGRSRAISKTLDASDLGLDLGGTAFRFTFVPLSIGTDDLVIRIWSDHFGPEFGQMGVPDGIEKAMLATSCGTILFTGGAGCGSSTLAIAYLNSCAKARKKVWYVDVESELFDVLPPSIRGVKCSSEDDLQSAAITVEKADPDILYLGQLDSKLKSTIASKFSSQGHLVVANMYANSSAQGIATYLEIGRGILPWQLLNSLAGVVNQRIERRLCHDCKQKVVWSETEFLQHLSTHCQMTIEDMEKATSKRSQGSPVETWRKKGCAKCHNTGYRGRVGLYGYVPISDQFRLLMSQDSSYSAIERALTTEGYFHKQHDALRKALLGQVSLDTVEEPA